MRIREYTPADLDALRRLHAAQGFGYPLPDLDSPMFVSKLVVEEEDDDSIADRNRRFRPVSMRWRRTLPIGPHARATRPVTAS
jgi:hypothetical protein